MKYPCNDGVDRDAEIDRYISLAQQRDDLQVHYYELEDKIDAIERELSRITTEKLGLAGYLAAVEAFSRKIKNERNT